MTTDTDNGRKKHIAELRAKIRSYRGKISRRETAILFARGDIREFETLISSAERLLAELGVEKRQARRPK